MTKRAALALLQAEPDPPDQPLRRLNVEHLLQHPGRGDRGGRLRHLGADRARQRRRPDRAGHAAHRPGDRVPLRAVPAREAVPGAELRLGPARPRHHLAEPARGQSGVAGPLSPGPEIGIAGLPALPAPGLLVGQPWSVCVQTETSSATLASHTLTTLVGGQGVGGRPLSGRRRAGGRRGRQRLAGLERRTDADPAGAADGHPHRPWLRADRGAGAAVLAGRLLAGADFAPPVVAGFGGPVARGPAGGPARIGQVFVTSPGAPQYYVLTRQGLTPVTSTEAKLLDAAPARCRRAP